MEKEHTHDHDRDRIFTVEVAETSQTKRVLSFKIPRDELEREKDHVVLHLRQEVKVPGFRKGKVPERYVRKNYEGMIEGDAVRNLLPAVYEQAIAEQKLHPLSEPRFENLEVKDGIVVEAHIEIRPEVKIKGYDKLTINATLKVIGDDEVNHTLEHLQERSATLATVEREAIDTDFLMVDYAPYDDSGELDEASRQSNHPIDLASENLLKEFREGLIGAKSGDEKDLTVDYPSDFGDEKLAGSHKKFHIKVLEVKEKLLPELDDAFARQMANLDSMDDFKRRIQEDMTAEEEKRYNQDVNDQIIDQLIGKNEFEVPDVMVDNYLSSLIEEDRRRRPEVPDEEQRISEIRELFSEAAVRTIKKYFIVEAVKKQEALSLTNDEIEARVQKLIGSSGRPEDEIRDFLKQPERRRSFEGDLMDEKVLDFLRERTTIKAG